MFIKAVYSVQSENFNPLARELEISPNGKLAAWGDFSDRGKSAKIRELFIDGKERELDWNSAGTIIPHEIKIITENDETIVMTLLTKRILKNLVDKRVFMSKIQLNLNDNSIDDQAVQNHFLNI